MYFTMISRKSTDVGFSKFGSGFGSLWQTVQEVTELLPISVSFFYKKSKLAKLTNKNPSRSIILCTLPCSSYCHCPAKPQLPSVRTLTMAAPDWTDTVVLRSWQGAPHWAALFLSPSHLPQDSSSMPIFHLAFTYHFMHPLFYLVQFCSFVQCLLKYPLY